MSKTEVKYYIQKVTNECEHSSRFKAQFKDFKQLGTLADPQSERIFSAEYGKNLVFEFFKKMIIENYQLLMQIYELNNKCMLFSFVSVNGEKRCFITMSGGFRDAKNFKNFEKFKQKDNRLNQINKELSNTKCKHKIKKLQQEKEVLTREIKDIEEYKFFRKEQDRLESELQVRNAFSQFSENTQINDFTFQFARKNRSSKSNDYFNAHTRLEERHYNRNCAEKTMMLWLMKKYFKNPEMKVLGFNSTMVYDIDSVNWPNSPIILHNDTHKVVDIPPCQFCHDLMVPMFFLWRSCQVLGSMVLNRNANVHQKLCQEIDKDDDDYAFSKKIKYMMPSYLVKEMERDIFKSAPKKMDLDSSDESSFKTSKKHR